MNPLQKNELVEVVIDDMGNDGEGVAHVNGYTLFIKDALIGERVIAKITKLNKGFGFARLMEIKEESPNRVQPKCELAMKCGGCQIQHLSYEKQLEYKQKKVKNCMERIGGFSQVPMEQIIGMENPYYYRNKAQFPVGRGKNEDLLIGFYAGRTHSIINTTECVIQNKESTEVIKIIREFMTEYKILPYDEKTGSGLVRHILIRKAYATGELMVCLVINGKKVPKEEILIERLKLLPGIVSICLNENREVTNVILGKTVRVLWGKGFITDQIDDITYQISPLSFYQVNPVQTKHLYEQALEYASLTGKETVFDLYCGIGTISLFLAKMARIVYGVEIVPEAIEDARKNADLNNIQNTKFYVGAAEEVVDDLLKIEDIKKHGVDVVVVDPPRKGCDKSLLDTILKILPKRIVYVSCDPATLARDCKVLCEQEYDLKAVKPVDMFCHTKGVETVALLTLKR